VGGGDLPGRGTDQGEGFAIDASVSEADASRYHGVKLARIDWSAVQTPTRAVREYLDALDHSEGLEADRKIPKLLSLPGPASAWTAKANKRVQFGYGLNCNAHAN
jgi:hypothetical protein